MSNDLKCLPINFYLLTMFDALCDGLEGHFLGIGRGVRRGNVFYYVYKRFFVTFFTFLTFFFKFSFERFFYIYAVSSLTTI